MGIFKSIDNFIIATAEKMIEILESDLLAAIIILLIIIGVSFQLIRYIF
tara:strand:+ start:135 stop:281 length:147 start_codon:yes stop_codon:yes gene_type:complete